MTESIDEYMKHRKDERSKIIEKIKLELPRLTTLTDAYDIYSLKGIIIPYLHKMLEELKEEANQ